MTTCTKLGIQLMSHSPLKGMMRNRNAQQLASELGVGVPLLALRYGLQRGFVEIFGSKTPDHMRSNLNVFAFELNASTLANIACWNPGSLCNHLN